MISIKIVFSTEDEAGTLVAAQLKKKFGFPEEKNVSEKGKTFSVWQQENGLAELIQVSERLSNNCEFLSGLPQVLACKLIVFTSRHVSESGTPCFTSHATGNFTGKSEFGGNALELGFTSARASACLLKWLKSNPLEGYGVFREATHHGPTSLPCPSFFAELGSTGKEWRDEKAAAHLAQAIVFAAENFAGEGGAPSVGFGGTHYCSKFSALEFGGKNCFSHVASKHVLDGIEKEGVGQAIEKTFEKSVLKEELEMLLDWKGTNLQQREKLKKIFGELGLEWKRI